MTQAHPSVLDLDLTAGNGIEIDKTDPTAPIISALIQEEVLNGANIYQITGNLKHKGLTVQIFPTTITVPTSANQGNKKWVIVWREGVNHSYDGNSVLKAADSYDQGKSLQNIRTIWNEATVDARDFSGAIMNNGRIGLLITRELGTTSFGKPMFLYSDDKGVTWNTYSATASSIDGLSFDEYLHNIPASAGGGPNSWIAFGWINPARTNITYLRTDNNGQTWTSGTAVNTVSGEDWSEPRVERLGSENRWVMVIRRNQSEGLNALITKSTNLTSWDVPIDSGQQVGRNCMTLLYENDKLNWFVFSRSYATSAMAIGNFRDGLLVQSLDGLAVWNSLNSWTGWKLFASMFRPLGYLKFVRDNNKLYGIFAYNEREVADGASYTNLAILTNDVLFNQLGAMSGANSVGSWIAYPDGRLECWGLVQISVVTSPWGSVHLSNNTFSFNFPNNAALTFSEKPNTIFNIESSAQRGWVTGPGNPGDPLTTFNFEIISPVSVAGQNMTVSWRTIGKWS